MNRPGPLRYIAYSFGRKVPDEMRYWVRNDLTGDHVLMAVILALIYSFAFLDMNRRRPLSQHGFPKDLENKRKIRQHNSSRRDDELALPRAVSSVRP